MAIKKNITVSYKTNSVAMSEQIELFRHDHGIEFMVELKDFNYQFSNQLGSNILRTTNARLYTISIQKPSPDKNGKPVFIKVPLSPVVDGAIKFTIDKTMTDEITEIGEYRLQVHLYDLEGNTMSLPPFSFKVKELLDPGYQPEDVIVDGNVVYLPGNSVTKEDITVQLGSGGKVGGLSTGDLLPKGTDLTSFIKELTVKRIYPQYVKPTLSLSTNISLNQEYGSTISPTLTPNFIKNDAGEAVELIYKRNDSVLTRINTCNSYTDSNLVIKEKTVYSLTLNYGNGIAKEDNLGDLYQEGIIKAGSITANLTINAKYPYWGAALDSDNIPSASTFTTINKTGIGAVKNTQITVKTKPYSTRTVVFAYDKALGDANKIRYVESNDDANMSAFTKTEVNIKLLDGSTKTYNVYYYTALIPFQSEGTFIMTI